MNKADNNFKDSKARQKSAEKKIRSLATYSDSELEKEIVERKMKMKFPLHIFPELLSPLINKFTDIYKAENAYTGLSILSIAGALIGKSVCLEYQEYSSYPKFWFVLMGETSTYKSQTTGFWLKPLYNLHLEIFENYKKDKAEWDEIKKNEEPMPIEKSLLEKDIFMFTLKRKVLKNNPRGVLMFHDEMKSWLSSFQQGNKESSDETEWLSLHSDKGIINVTRGGNQEKEVVVDPFISLLGTTQPAFAYYYFHKERDVSGFANRFIFGICDQTDLQERGNNDVKLDSFMWKAICEMLYKKLKFDEKDDDYNIKIRYNEQAYKRIIAWNKKQISEINEMSPSKDKTLIKNWFGKATLHLNRVALVLAVLDTVCDYISTHHIRDEEYLKEHLQSKSYDLHFKEVDLNQAERAIEVIEYSKYSMKYAYDCYLDSVLHEQVPPQIRRIISMLRKGMTRKQIWEIVCAEGYQNDYTRFCRYLQELKATHPNLFK